MKRRIARTPRPRVRERGATLAEFVVAFPTLLMLLLSVAQTALVYHAKSNLNYAALEAARAGSFANAQITNMTTAFGKAMIGYYGGGNTAFQLADTLATKVLPDLAPSQATPLGGLRIEIISPTRESFNDYFSPELAQRLKTSQRVLPNTNVAYMSCPRDRTGCNSNPASNTSGQTLADANLLKVRITYGIPTAKQVPFIGRFYTWALSKINTADTDAFRRALVEAGRIPIVTHATVRMQSEAIENVAMASNAGPGNNGTPADPGLTNIPGLLPACPFWDPTCMTCKDGLGKPPCEVDSGTTPVDPGGGGECKGDDCGVCEAPASMSSGSASTNAGTSGK